MRFARISAGCEAGWTPSQGGAVYRAEDGHDACADLIRWGAPPRAEAALVRLQPQPAPAGAAQGQDRPWHWAVATDLWPEQLHDFNTKCGLSVPRTTPITATTTTTGLIKP
jgi:hypothetical protein